MFLLPWSSLFTGGQADDHIANARCPARLERQFARDTISLVKQTEHGNPLRHRRRTIGRISAIGQVNRRHIGRRLVIIKRGMRCCLGIGISNRRLATTSCRHEQRNHCCRLHPAASIGHASGVQAS